MGPTQAFNLGQQVVQVVDLPCAVRAAKLLQCGQRGVVHLQCNVQARGAQVVVDGGQALWAFRVPRPHVVQLAIAMAVEGGDHGFVPCYFWGQFG